MELLLQDEETFRDALVDTFTQDDLDALTTFGLGFSLDRKINTARGLEGIAKDLVIWCKKNGQLARLYLAAVKRSPDSPALKAFTARLRQRTLDFHNARRPAYRLSPDAASTPHMLPALQEGWTTESALQAMVTNYPDAGTKAGGKEWAAELQNAMGRVCKVLRNGSGIGTGFLVGPDLVMTCAHVFPPGTPPADWSVVFDYLSAEQTLASLPALAVMAECAHSTTDQFDFVVLRIDPAVKGQNRGFFSPADYNVSDGEPMFLLQMPKADQPVSLNVGVLADANENTGQIAYTANTAPGSSGSPVFNAAWQLVAMHYHGQHGVANHGIWMKAILAAKDSTFCRYPGFGPGFFKTLAAGV